MKDISEKKDENIKILLMLAPFWSPLTPPLGISCLKGCLTSQGYCVKTVDANTVPGLWDFHSRYLGALRECIPDEKQGNFYMVGYDVLMNHLTAHIHYEDETLYHKLVKTLVLKNFFSDIEDPQVKSLISIVEEFYACFEDYLRRLLEKEKPDLLGISVYNSTLGPSLFSFRLAKKVLANVTTVMGGGIFADQLSLNSPNLKRFVDNTPYLDKILIGEGELLFMELLEGGLKKTQKIYSIMDIGGRYMELSSAKIPDFSDFAIEVYPQLATYVSRSCPFQCSFCSETVQWGRYRKKDIPQVVDELVTLNKMYQRQLFLLGDSLINPVVDELASEVIRRDLSLYWDAYLRADPPVCNPDNTILWRRGGFYRARLGIESGSQKVLDLMDKKTRLSQIKEAVISLATAGIKTTTYWVLGHPGETEEDFRQTLTLLEELKEYIYEADWHPFFYYPSGQVNSQRWADKEGIRLVYSEEMTPMLITQTWELITTFGREEIYERVRRFGEHCKKHNIPNPYSIKDIYEADSRWKRLQKNAVPSINEFRGELDFITENKRVKKLMTSQSIEIEGDFDF